MKNHRPSGVGRAPESRPRRTASIPGGARLALTLAAVLVVLAPSGARAEIQFNLDFGIFYGVPPVEDGAAANQPGVWNEAPIGITSLVDTSGAITLAEVEVVATNHGSSSGGNEMIRDNFYVAGATPGPSTSPGCRTGSISSTSTPRRTPPSRPVTSRSTVQHSRAFRAMAPGTTSRGRHF